MEKRNFDEIDMEILMRCFELFQKANDVFYEYDTEVIEEVERKVLTLIKLTLIK